MNHPTDKSDEFVKENNCSTLNTLNYDIQK